MSYERLKHRLDAGEIVILDGATGTELERRGATMSNAAWCAPATLENDQLLTEIHADYIRVGSQVVTANTFSAARMLLKDAGLADRAPEIAQRAVEAALRAREMTHKPEVVVAGSLSHMVPIAKGLAAADPKAVPSDAEIGESLDELARNLAAAGCDLIILEMMYYPARIRLALKAALATGLPVWFGASARRAKTGAAVAFYRHEDIALDAIASLIPAEGVDVAGVMHSEAAVMEEALAAIRRRFDGPLMAYPDSGYFEMPNWRFVDIIAPGRLEQFFADWLRAGVRVIGGCCGLAPEHIAAAVRARAAFAGRGTEWE